MVTAKLFRLAILLIAFPFLLVLSVQASRYPEWDQFLSGLKPVHFQDTFPKLVQREHSVTPKGLTLAEDLFSANRPIFSQDDLNINAGALRKHLEDVSDDTARQKFDRLCNAILARALVSNNATLNSLVDFTQRSLYPYAVKSLAKLSDDDQQRLLGNGKSLLGLGNRLNFRLLILGLNSLIVSRLRETAKSAVFGLNQFALIDPTELKSFKGLILDIAKVNSTFNSTTAKNVRLLQGVSTPATVNWVAANAVGPVQNQGSCGSCWAFVSLSVLQSRLVIAGKGNLTVLSQQQITSCSRPNGCGGGYYSAAWDYVNSVGGVVAASVYPYNNANSETALPCNQALLRSPIVTTTTSVSQISSEAEMRKVIARTGPVAISISTPACFQFYQSGVLTQQDCSCYTGPSSIDHAVTVVGYGTDSTTNIQYWQIQNSWGVNWGMAGYIEMEAGLGYPGMCGLLVNPQYPNSVTLSSDCAGSTPPSYCFPVEPTRYSNTNGTSDEPGACVENAAGSFPDPTCDPNEPSASNPGTIPIWGWALIGIGVGLVVILFIIFCIYMQCRAGGNQRDLAKLYARKDEHPAQHEVDKSNIPIVHEQQQYYEITTI
jgi:hypothetical protein